VIPEGHGKTPVLMAEQKDNTYWSSPRKKVEDLMNGNRAKKTKGCERKRGRKETTSTTATSAYLRHVIAIQRDKCTIGKGWWGCHFCSLGGKSHSHKSRGRGGEISMDAPTNGGLGRKN